MVHTTAKVATARTITASKIQGKVMTPCTPDGCEPNPSRSSAETLRGEDLGAVDAADEGAVE
jgi:hypothetical protein